MNQFNKELVLKCNRCHNIYEITSNMSEGKSQTDFSDDRLLSHGCSPKNAGEEYSP